MALNTNLFNLAYSPATKLLIYAVRNNRPNVARRSIHLGANVNVKLPNGDFLLHICLSETMGSILINNDANVNARNSTDETPLHTAMRRGLVQLSLLLLANNADVNAQDQNGTAPLHLAESDEVNDAILAQNPNLNVQDSAGDTPLHLAIRIKGSPMVTSLTDRDARKDIKNNAGNTAYDEVLLLIARRESELAKVADAVFGPLSLEEVKRDAIDLKDRFVQAEQQFSALIDAPLQKIESAFPAFQLSKQCHTPLSTTASSPLNSAKYTPKLIRN